MAKVSMPAVATCLLGIYDLALASPRYSEDYSRLFWFVVVTDSHVCEQMVGGDQDTVNLEWLTGEAFEVIKPRFIFNCGDLVDGCFARGIAYGHGGVPTPGLAFLLMLGFLRAGRRRDW